MTNKENALRLQNQIFFPMYLCVKEMSNYCRSLLEPYDLTYTQFIVLMYLWEKEQSSLTEASDALLFDPSTLTPVLKKLEKKGYITRERDKADERQLILKPAEAGISIVTEMSGLPEKLIAHTGLSSMELEQFRALAIQTLDNVCSANTAAKEEDELQDEFLDGVAGGVKTVPKTDDRFRIKRKGK